jgi:uncharacterized protein involved in exopolysaccharide biosynthesis
MNKHTAMLPDGEFVPLDYVKRAWRWGWLVALLTVLGAAAGLVFHQFNPPVYEAAALFSARVDTKQLTFMHPPAPTPIPYRLSDYDQDLSLAVVEASLRQVEPQVVDFARQNGLPLDRSELEKLSTIERKNAIWEVHFRSTDPALTQKVVNTWAQAGLANLQTWQKSGQIPPYILFSLTQLAELPASPTYFQPRVLVLAGALIGLLVGIGLVSLPLFQRGKKGLR